MNLKQAELILMDNLKGQKNKMADILSIAKAVSTVKQHYTSKDMREMFSITSTSIDRINSINKLNDIAKKLISSDKIKIEQAYHLSRLSGKRQDDAARLVSSMNAHHSRIFVKMLLMEPNKTVQECKKIFDKTNISDVSIVMVPMPTDMYTKLAKIATKQEKEPQDIILKLTEGFIGR